MQTKKTQPRKGLKHQIRIKRTKNVNKYFQKNIKVIYFTQDSLSYQQKMATTSSTIFVLFKNSFNMA